MCVFCGKSPTPQSECLCTRTKHLGRVVSLWKYEKPVSQLIKNCKYYDKPRAAILILQFLRTEQLARVLSLVKNCENPTLVPVPPHKDRLQERGFDQARLIAETLSLILAVPVVKKGAVLRILKTPPQAKQNSKEDRLKNVLGAFYLTDPKELSGKTAVLVDDVLTTGATLISLAQTIYHYTRLKTAGIVLAHETR